MTGVHGGLLVQGFCPMGCGETLFLSGGRVTCGHALCPRPEAAFEILGDSETEHLVDVGATTFQIQHPLRERLDGELLCCPVHADLARADGPPRVLRLRDGRYRVSRVADGSIEWAPA